MKYVYSCMLKFYIFLSVAFRGTPHPFLYFTSYTCVSDMISHFNLYSDILMCLFDCVAGSVYFYSKTGSSWSRQGKILAADGAVGDYFGTALSLYTSSALIGAHGDDDNNGLNSGEENKMWEIIIFMRAILVYLCRFVVLHIRSYTSHHIVCQT